MTVLGFCVFGLLLLLLGNVSGDAVAASSACNASAFSAAHSTVVRFVDCVIDDAASWKSVIIPASPLVTSVVLHNVTVNVSVGLLPAADYPGATTMISLNFTSVTVNAPVTVSEAPLLALSISNSQVHSTIFLASSAGDAAIQPTIWIASSNVTANVGVSVRAEASITMPHISAERVRFTTSESNTAVSGSTALVSLSSPVVSDLSLDLRHSTFDLFYGNNQIGAYMLMVIAAHFNGTTRCHVDHVNFTANLGSSVTLDKTTYSAAAIFVMPESSIQHVNVTITDSTFVARIDTSAKRPSQAFVVWLAKKSTFAAVSYVGFVHVALSRVAVDFRASSRAAAVVLEIGVMTVDSPFLQLTARDSRFFLEVVGNFHKATFADIVSSGIAALVGSSYVLFRSASVFNAERLFRTSPARFELLSCVVSAYVWTDYDGGAAATPSLLDPFQNTLLLANNAVIICTNATELIVVVLNSTLDLRVIQRAARYVYMSFGSVSAVVCLLSSIEAARIDVRLENLIVNMQYNVTPKPADPALLSELKRLGVDTRGFGAVAGSFSVVVIDAPTVCTDTGSVMAASTSSSDGDEVPSSRKSRIELRGLVFSRSVPSTIVPSLDAARGGMCTGLIFFASFDKDFRLLGLTSLIAVAVASIAFPAYTTSKPVCHFTITVEDVFQDLTEAASVLYLPPDRDEYRRYTFTYCAGFLVHETVLLDNTVELVNLSFRLPIGPVVGLPASTCLSSDRVIALIIFGNSSIAGSSMMVRNMQWTQLPRSQPIVFSVNASWTGNNITVEKVSSTQMGQLCLPTFASPSPSDDMEGPWSLLRRDRLSAFRRTRWEISNATLSSSANGTLFPLPFSSSSNWLEALNRVTLQCVVWNGAPMPPALLGVGADAVDGSATACGSTTAAPSANVLAPYATRVSASSLTAAGVVAAASATGIAGTSLPLQMQKSLAVLRMMVVCGTSSFDDESVAPGFATTDNPLQFQVASLDAIAVWLPWSVGAILGNVVVVAGFSALVFAAGCWNVWQIASSLSLCDEVGSSGGDKPGRRHTKPGFGFRDVVVVSMTTSGLPVAAWPSYAFVAEPTFYAAATALWQAISPAARETSSSTEVPSSHSTAEVIGVALLAAVTLVLCVMPLLHGVWRLIPTKRLEASFHLVKSRRRDTRQMLVPKRGRSGNVTRFLRCLARVFTWLFAAANRWTTLPSASPLASPTRVRGGNQRAQVIGAMWLPLIEPYRHGFHWFFAVDLGQSLLIAALTTCGAMVGTPWSCLAIQWVNLAVAVVVLFVVVLWRPFQTKFDLIVTGSAYLLNALVGIGGVMESVELAATAVVVQSVLGAASLFFPALAALLSHMKVLNLLHLRCVPASGVSSDDTPCAREALVRERLGLSPDPASNSRTRRRAAVATAPNEDQATKERDETALVPLGVFMTSVTANPSHLTTAARLAYLVQRVCRNERRRAVARTARHNGGTSRTSGGAVNEVRALDEIFLLPDDTKTATRE